MEVADLRIEDFFGPFGFRHEGFLLSDKIRISIDDVRKIAETKMPDLNAASLEAAMSMIAGTCRSMGVVVED